MKKLFSIFALAASLVACQPEKLVTTFKVDDAKVKITVTCIDVTTGAVVTPTLSASTGTVSGQEVFVTGNPSIAETEVTVKTTYKNTEFSGKITINDLKAGKEAFYSLVIPVGTLPGDYTLSLVQVSSKKNTTVSKFAPYKHSYKHNYTHAGYVLDTWGENNTEWALEADFDVEVIFGRQLSNLKIINKEFAPVVNLYVENIIKGLKEADLDFRVEHHNFHTLVAAWSLYCGFVEYTTAELAYNIVATNKNKFEEIVATVDANDANTTEISVLEIEHPNAHGHFQPGHGHTEHGHGLDNSGGGIISAE